jgi:hypothetical protein
MKTVTNIISFAGLAVCVAAALGAPPALAKLVTYNVNMNFDPTIIDGPPGVGTVTGTVTIDTGTPAVTAVDLVEKTNNGHNVIGGAFGSPSYSSFTFDQTAPFTIIFFGSPSVFPTATATVNKSYISLFFRTNCCNLDGLPIGPSIQFDFPYPGGGSVVPGNFDSVTSETRYLFGTVTPAISSGVPEPATWALMLLGFAGLRMASYRHGKAGRALLMQG